MASLIINGGIIHSADALKGKQKKALKQIDKALIRATEGNITSIDMLNISKKLDDSVIVVINKTKPALPPIPIPPVTNETQPPVTNETQPPISNETLPPMPNNLCPPGTHFFNSTLCVRDNEVNCPEGTILNTTTTSCQPSGIPVPPTNTTQPPLPPQCMADEHIEDGVCVKNPAPPIGGNASSTKLCMAGDLSGSAVPNAMKAAKCNFTVGIGDLGYKSDLSWFKSLNFNKCVIGNHDSLEDGSASLQKESLAYCGDHWFKILAGDSTIIIGLNTNGDEKTQLDFVKSIPLNNYKNVIVISHKNGHTFPNAHHPAESKSLYASIEALPIEGKLYEISGHNHNMASADNNGWFISGAGGRSHYSCGTDSNWKFCDASHYGFLQMDIDNSSGNVKANFIDTNGKVIH